MTATDRRALLYAALVAVLVKRRTPELAVVHALLDSWRGIGFIVVGMLRQGFDLSLVSYPQGWRATFLHRNHVLHPWVGQVITWWPTPWRAVQEAAWQALNTPFAKDNSASMSRRREVIAHSCSSPYWRRFAAPSNHATLNHAPYCETLDAARARRRRRSPHRYESTPRAARLALTHGVSAFLEKARAAENSLYLPVEFRRESWAAS